MLPSKNMTSSGFPLPSKQNASLTNSRHLASQPCVLSSPWNSSSIMINSASSPPSLLFTEFASSDYRRWSHPTNKARLFPAPPPTPPHHEHFRSSRAPDAFLSEGLPVFLRVIPKMLFPVIQTSVWLYSHQKALLDFPKLNFELYSILVFHSIMFFTILALITTCYHIPTNNQVVRICLSHYYTVGLKGLAVLHMIFYFYLPNIHCVGILILISGMKVKINKKLASYTWSWS